MSVMEKNKVDGIGKSKEENKIVLMISDHLDWDNEMLHLKLLQDKINAYIEFIESGQVYNNYPDAKSVDGFIFEINFKYNITENCRKLLDVVEKSTQDLKIELVIN